MGGGRGQKGNGNNKSGTGGKNQNNLDASDQLPFAKKNPEKETTKSISDNKPQKNLDALDQLPLASEHLENGSAKSETNSESGKNIDETHQSQLAIAAEDDFFQKLSETTVKYTTRAFQKNAEASQASAVEHTGTVAATETAGDAAPTDMRDIATEKDNGQNENGDGENGQIKPPIPLHASAVEHLGTVAAKETASDAPTADTRDIDTEKDSGQTKNSGGKNGKIKALNAGAIPVHANGVEHPGTAAAKETKRDAASADGRGLGKGIDTEKDNGLNNGGNGQIKPPIAVAIHLQASGVEHPGTDAATETASDATPADMRGLVRGGATEMDNGQNKNGGDINGHDNEFRKLEKYMNRKKADLYVVANVLKTCRATAIVEKSQKSMPYNHENAKRNIPSAYSHPHLSQKWRKKQKKSGAATGSFEMVSIRSLPQIYKRFHLLTKSITNFYLCFR